MCVRADVLIVTPGGTPAKGNQSAAEGPACSGETPGSHALRGNPRLDALRPVRSELETGRRASRLRSHAERGNEEITDEEASGPLPDASYIPSVQVDTLDQKP
jgi:hypothetical protein